MERAFPTSQGSGQTPEHRDFAVQSGSPMGANMKKLFVLAIVLALAIVLILTKPTPQEIASAATGQMNYTVINREKMPPDFAAQQPPPLCPNRGRRVCHRRPPRRSGGAVAHHRSRLSDVLGFDGCPRRLVEMPLALSQRLLLLYVPVAEMHEAWARCGRRPKQAAPRFFAVLGFAVPWEPHGWAIIIVT